MKKKLTETSRQRIDAANPSEHRRRLLLAMVGALGSSALVACGGGGSESVDSETTDSDSTDPSSSTPTVNSDGVTLSALADTPQWTAATHGKLGTTALAANVATVFPSDKVRRIDIKIENANWLLMRSNLAVLAATLGNSRDFTSLDDPVTVPCSVWCDGIEWYKVGVRYKGNSSLYNANSGKLPLKLKFNEFEDDYPAITGQRFYGFKTLHLKNGYQDASALREHLVDDIFRDWGLASSHSAFYQIYLDVGDGSGALYWGLYTLVEDVEDTVLKLQFTDDDGNLYKPDDDAGSFATGTFDTDELALKTNEEGATYADVQALYTAINNTATYNSNRTAWKAALEAVFDVPKFLRWLAANTVIQNWDSYGAMPHNYYLYANADNGGRLEWLPWDNNEALSSNPQCLPLNLASSTAWPLVYYIGGDSDYRTLYTSYVREFVRSHFDSSTLGAVIDARAALIRSAVASERSGYTFTSASAFTNAVAALKMHIASRQQAALAFAG
ncbi:MAG: CotH kinase family protein [Giesbergeria sp.]|nr:CotH kinase family protein [Giesbergeria sp.]